MLDGANDYLTKPFHTEELLARIKVQLRMDKEKRKKKDLTYKEMVLKEKEHQIYLRGQTIHFTKTEYAIMKQLLLAPKQVVTKNQLLDLISEDTLDCDENSLKVHISNIRKKIKKVTEEEYIESVWGIGFKLYDEES